MVHVRDALDSGVLAQRRGVKAHAAHHREAGLELGHRLGAGAFVDNRADRLVAVQHQQACDVMHGHDAAGKAPFGARHRGALVRAQREGVDIGAAEAFHRRDQIGAHALRHEAQLLVDARVHHPGAAIAAHGPAAHALDAAADHQVFITAGDLGRSQVHTLQARGAEAALGDAGHGLRPLGVEHRGARDVGALLAHRGHAADHQVIDQRRVQRTALLQRLQHCTQQPHRAGLVQAAVLLALAARRAHVVVDVGTGHGRSPLTKGSSRFELLAHRRVDDAQLGQRGLDVGALGFQLGDGGVSAS